MEVLDWDFRYSLSLQHAIGEQSQKEAFKNLRTRQEKIGVFQKITPHGVPSNGTDFWIESEGTNQTKGSRHKKKEKSWEEQKPSSQNPSLKWPKFGLVDTTPWRQ